MEQREGRNSGPWLFQRVFCSAGSQSLRETLPKQGFTQDVAFLHFDIPTMKAGLEISQTPFGGSSAIRQEARAERTSQSTRGSSCEANRGKKPTPKVHPAVFQAFSQCLWDSHWCLNPDFISKLQGTSSTNHFCSAREAAGPREAADTSLKMSGFGLPLENKNPRATGNSKSLGKTLVCKRRKTIWAARKLYY